MVIRVAMLVVAGFVFAGTSHAQERERLSVERIFASPSLSGVSVSAIKWSPDSKKIAYLRADASAGQKELWVFDPGQKRSSLLLKATDLIPGEQQLSPEEESARERRRESGSGIMHYLWSPDSKKMIIPLNGDMFSVDLNSRHITRLTETPEPEIDPKVSPDGTYLAYVRRGEIYLLDLLTKSERKLTSGATAKIKNGVSEFVAQEEMGRHTGYWWSPDSKNIAFLQIDNTNVREFHIVNYLTDYSDVTVQEYPKAGEANTVVRVGIVPVFPGKTTWLNLGVNTDVYVPRVEWFPDGRRLAVQIQSRDQDTLSLMLFDPQRGTSSLLLREIDPYWVRLHDGLKFLNEGKEFIWLSERDGYKHIYYYTTIGGGRPESSTLIHQITQGKWDVDEVVGVDEKAGVVYFTAFEKTPLERHLYSAKLDGSGMSRVSVSDGTHSIVMSPDKQAFVDTYSSTARPPLVAYMTVSKSAATMIEENPVDELERYDLPKPEFLTIKSADGKHDLHAYIIKPSNIIEQKQYPVIMYQYNGPTSRVVENAWQGVRMLWHRSMAAQGYIVFAVDGRGTPGRGRGFQNMLHKQLGKVELEDQLAGAAYVKSLPYVDSTRVMMWGKSYGGFITCLAMFTTTAFKLGIAVAPVTDWKNYDTHYTERYMERPQENPDGYRNSSPVNHASGLNGKFLLLHGVVDDNVHFQDSMILVDALQKANKQFDFMAYPASTHSFSGQVAGTHWYNLMTRYIHDNL